MLDTKAPSTFRPALERRPNSNFGDFLVGKGHILRSKTTEIIYFLDSLPKHTNIPGTRFKFLLGHLKCLGKVPSPAAMLFSKFVDKKSN